MEHNYSETEASAQHLFDTLENVSNGDIKKNAALYISVLNNTTYPGLRSLVAKKLTEAEVGEVYLSLIRNIIKGLPGPYIGPLCYCCTKFNCADHWELFSDILVLKQDISAVHAASIIMNMENLSAGKRYYMQQKFRLHLSALTPQTPAHEIVADVINSLEQPYIPS